MQSEGDKKIVNSHLIQNYARLAVEFDCGSGVWLWDTDGKRYLDALSGIAVCGLGHAHPQITHAINKQAKQLIHTSNLYNIGIQKKLADKLTTISHLDNAFFCNSGTEANEAAIKFSRLWAHRHGHTSPTIITLEGAFHGRTLGALAATDSHAESLFGPLPTGFVQIPFNDIVAIERTLAEQPQVCAVMVEPIQGESGIRTPDQGYLTALRELCDRHNILLILDEIQTGVGRTGAWYCCQHENVRPDILTTAKALGNGIPIGACLTNTRVAECIEPGMHGSTFGGNPLACATALAVLEIIETEKLCEKAATIGEYLITQLQTTFAKTQGVTAIRGKGLMVGIELNKPCKPLMQEALEQGLLINVTAERVIRLLPPLILEQKQADIIIATLAELIPTFIANAA